MQSTDYFDRKIEALRRLETYGYQLAYYILQDEDLALEATKMTLLAVAQVDELYNMPAAVQRNLMKKSAIRQSMMLKYEARTAI